MHIPLQLPWACPVCGHGLSLIGKSWACELKHSFDMAKQGYVNLLLANQKNSTDPGDSKAMLQARRAFLAAGHFNPIIDKLVEQVTNLSSEKPEPFSPESYSLVDLGCGEGTYLSAILSSMLSAERDKSASTLKLGGLDISKDAVSLAAKRDKHAEWVCASTTHIPLLSNSIDCAISVFAPHPHQEIARILKPDGHWIVIAPNADHLVEIKQKLYQHPKEILPDVAFPHFECEDMVPVRYVLSLQNNVDIHNLLAMTPFFWRGDKIGREEILASTTLDAHIDVSLYRFRYLP